MAQTITFEFFDFVDATFHAAPFHAAQKLQGDVVHVWRRSLVADPIGREHASSFLSDEEHERASRYRVEHARNAFVLTRSALRVLLGYYSGESPQSIRFRLTEYDKPFLDQPFHLHFNVSHTDGLALLAFAQSRRVGVDVERIRPQPDALKLARRFFSEREQQQLEHLSPEELPAAFFRCWCRKEAYIKARGEGLSLPLDQFDVAVEADPGRILLSTRPDPGEAQRWLLRDLPVPSEYWATAAVSGFER